MLTMFATSFTLNGLLHLDFYMNNVTNNGKHYNTNTISLKYPRNFFLPEQKDKRIRIPLIIFFFEIDCLYEHLGQRYLKKNLYPVLA